MKDLIGKRIKIVVNSTGEDLTFTAIVNQVSDSHITFTDKFNKRYKFLITLVKEVEEERVEERGENE